MLGKQGQRLLKAVHVAGAGIWLGGLVAMVALLSVGPTTPHGRARFGLDLAVATIHARLLLAAFVVTVVTALALALWTPWGFVRHRWIAAKWLLAALLFLATLVVQAPAVATLVGLADAGVDDLAGLSYDDVRHRTFGLALGQLGVVVAVFVISALKPWGLRRSTWAVPRRVALGLIATGAVAGVGMSLWGRSSLDRLRRAPLVDVDLASVPDGRWRGSAPADCSFGYVIELDVAGGHLVGGRVVVNRRAAYARLAEAVVPRMIAAQRLDVDAITGATTTSRCLMRAAARGLADAVPPPAR